MKCTENKRYLEPFLDGELDAEANLKVLEHLNLCGECNRTFDAEKGLRAALRDKCAGPAAPKELCARVAALLDRVDGQARRRWLVPVVAVAASFAAVLVTAFVLTRAPSGPIPERELARQAVGYHERNRDSCADESICLHCSKEPKADAKRFFESKTGAATCLHDLDKAGYAWRSGVVWRLRGELHCWTVQRNEARNSLISHVTLRTRQVTERSAGGGWRRYDTSGRVVLAIDMPDVGVT